MILHRIANHLKQQHWTGVFIELVIVIVGVFIGTNVTNWNDALKQQERSRIYTQRLLDDLRIEYARDRSLIEYDTDARQAGIAAFDGLTERRTLDDRTVLVNAYRAIQFQWYERHAAAFDEMLSAGELDLVSDPKLRETAVRYYGNSSTTHQLVLEDKRDSDYRRLFTRLVDPDVALGLRKDCGDRSFTSPEGVPGFLSIHYDCKLAIDDEAIKKAADALRADPGLLSALRRQIAVYDTEIGNLIYMLNETGIQALFARDGDR
ncbi:MAG: hypothetical protein WBW61_13545 [Rhodanobacteraceae bacterium]